MSEPVDSIIGKIFDRIESNRLDDVTYTYSMKLVKGSNFNVPDGVVLTGCVCILNVGEVEVTSTTSSMIGEDHSRKFYYCSKYSLEPRFISYCSKEGSCDIYFW